MQTISPEEFKRLYGTQGVAAFKEQPKQSGISTDIGDAFKGGIDKFVSGVARADKAKNPVESLEAGLQQGSGLVGAAFSPLAPVTKYVGKAVDYAGSKIADTPLIKGAAGNEVLGPGGTVSYKPNMSADRLPEDLANTADLLGLVGAKPAIKATGGAVSRAGNAVGGGVSKATEGVGKYVKGATKDIIPTTEGIITEQVTKALDLTPGDIDKISRSTGNNPGMWLAENNLIGPSKQVTEANITNFYKTNYDSVRSEIGKVDRVYAAYEIPRYIDALKQIINKVEKVPGLEEVWAEVSNLAGKKQISLNDVQRVKELLDDHFSLYKVTGDVGDNVTKQGLANMRSTLRSFIEDEVTSTTGADIRQLNNNVSTARSLGEAVKTRTPKGLTASNLKMGDAAALFGGMSFGGPIVGIAALFAKKALETPTVRLRIAKFMDEASDAKKARIKAELEAGEIPNDFKKIINIKQGGQRLPAE
jgi:hypothetical protein